MKKQFAVFGNPIEHSLSPQIHQRFAHQHKLDIAYSKRLSDDNNFKTDIAQFFDSGGVGCNVTMPLKELAFAMSEVLTEKAKRARAVNTLYLDDQSRLCGDNTDGGGLLRDLSNNIGISVHGKHIVILGAGGATRGVLEPLIEAQPASLAIINRTFSKAESLAEEFSDLFSIQTHDPSNLLPEQTDLLLNATSASLDAKLPISNGSMIRPDTICYDLAYAQKPTAFLQWTADCGSQHNHDGRGMLVEQAALAFEKWNDLKVNTAEIVRDFQELTAQ